MSDAFPYKPGDYIEHKNSSGDVIWKINAIRETNPFVRSLAPKHEVVLTPVYNPLTHPTLALMRLGEPEVYVIKHSDLNNWGLAWAQSFNGDL